MTVEEYIDGVIRCLEKTNKPIDKICIDKKFDINWLINKSECELCGAPHAVFSHPDGLSVTYILFFFSGSLQPSEKDEQFIQEFRHRLFYS